MPLFFVLLLRRRWRWWSHAITRWGRRGRDDSAGRYAKLLNVILKNNRGMHGHVAIRTCSSKLSDLIGLV